MEKYGKELRKENYTMSNIVRISWDDGFQDESFWHLSHKPNLHKLGIKRKIKTLDCPYNSGDNCVLVGSMKYCLTERPQYLRNGIYHLYKIDSWEMSGKNGEWVGKPQHNNTQKTEQLRVYDDIIQTNRRDDPTIEYYGQYKIKGGIAFPWKNGWENKNIEKKITKQFRLNTKKQNPEEYVKVLVEISMSNEKALAENNGKRFYTKRLKRKNLAPRDEWEQKRADDSRRRKLLKLQQKP